MAVHMSAPIEKALKLIALAVGSNSSEEARTAAMAAVRLISDHKLLEQAPAPRTAAVPTPDDPLQEWFRKQERYARNEAARRREAQPPAWDPAEHKRPDLPKGFIRTSAGGRICSKCQDRIYEIDAVHQPDNHTYWHSACFYRLYHGT